ncbi:Fc receptor-like protein 5 [Cynoglossus semilaevis]|uniref:Fc receptor-like protein 5 n=1 Tax=Cynoglossus semilaevis TaxID=244447 RepID=UPI000D628B6A|nr:Fc receptor-like protein 5 [Cynoglossus semilaevis]
MCQNQAAAQATVLLLCFCYNLLSVFSGVVLLVLQVAAPESQEVTVSVRPPGSNIYLGECVMLLCAVESNSTSVKNYLWFRSQKHSAPNPRHLVSRDSYYITAVTVEDADKYWCQAECRGNRSVYVVEARPVTLTVSDLSPPTLSLTPNARHMLGGERFTLQCPTSQTDSSSWKLMHFLPGNSTGTTVVSAHHLTPGGGVPAKNSDVLMFIAAGRNSGLYWCEGPAGRSNAVYITVSYGTIILKTPAFPVVEGETVSLYCQYQRGSHTKTSFFKNGEEIKKITTATSGRVTTMVIRNVTRDDEGFYRCASQDGKMQSSGSWLSVRPDRGNFTSLEEPPTSSSENAVRDSVLYRGVLKAGCVLK